MSVDTNIKHKNLAPYRRIRLEDDLRLLVAKELPGMASSLTIDTGGFRGRKLTVELADQNPGQACAIDRAG